MQLPSHRNITRPADVHLLCARYWPDGHGGVEQRMWHVSHALADLGLTVRVICENRCGAEPVESLRRSLEIRRVDPLNDGRLWRLRSMLEVRWWMHAIKTHAPSGKLWASAPPQAVAAILLGRANDLVYNPACCVGAMRDLAAGNAHLTTMSRPRMIERLDRFAYRRAGQVVVGSANVRDQLGKHYGLREVTITPHAADEVSPPRVDRQLARARWSLNDHTFAVGFVGRLDPCKAVEFLFQAVASRLFDANLRILMVGEGPDESRLHQVASALGVTDRLIWTGRLENPGDAYAAMDVLVLPSVYEAFGNVLLEAMSRGVPTIGRAGNQRDVLTASSEIIDHERTGIVIETPDPRELGDALYRMQHDARFLASLGEAARASASQWTWTDVAHRYANVMKLAPDAQSVRQAA